MTRHEKQKYYEDLALRCSRYVYLKDEEIGDKFFTMIRFDYMARTDLQRRIYKDSKLSAVKHGFLRTFDKIDKSFINKEKKRKLIYQMIDVYYDAFDNIKTQIDDISTKVKIKYCIYNNDDALECLTKEETRKVKRK
ncbi:MAG: hypothetical protein ACI4OT_02615 [Bacilli bacterium]